MPDFAIVDAHVHLYDTERFRYGWLAEVPEINRSHGLAEFDAARAEVLVDRLVFAEVAVDPGLHLGEAEWVQGLAAADPRLAGAVAHAPLEKGAAVEADLERLAALPVVRGIRRLIETEKNPAFVLEPDFLEAVRLLPRYGFTFDICVKSWGMTYAVELARACEEVTFILDHIGKPDIRNGLREPWWSQIGQFAALPNTLCKISGVITEADRRRWTPEAVTPYVLRALEAFGCQRCMYGSDWTVSELTHAYPDWVALLDMATAGASEAERRALWRETAIRAYRLDA